MHSANNIREDKSPNTYACPVKTLVFEDL